MFRSFFLGGYVVLATASWVIADPESIVSECRLLEQAFEATKAQKETAFTDILVGCPGYESWIFEMSAQEDSKAFHKALYTPKPTKVVSGGTAAHILFQRMITRGVPVEIALEMVETAAFDVAVSDFDH